MDWRGSSAFSSNWIRMIKILCSYSAADAVTGSKPYSGKAMVFFLCISAWTAVLFAGRGLRMKRYWSHLNSTGCLCRDWRYRPAIRSGKYPIRRMPCELYKMLKFIFYGFSLKASVSAFLSSYPRSPPFSCILLLYWGRDALPGICRSAPTVNFLWTIPFNE